MSCQSGLSNLKIISNLKEDDEIPNFAIHEEKQLTNRRYHLKNQILKELSADTKGGFTNYLQKHNVEHKKANEHEMLIIAKSLTKKFLFLLYQRKQC